MARKRVNTKFLITLGVIVMVLMFGVLLAKKFKREKPDKYLAVGREAMEKQNYEEAVKNFRRAVQLDNKNADNWSDYGDALNMLSSVDPQFLAKAREAWEQAVTINPGHKAALERLLSFWSELADLDPRPDYFEQIRKTAEALSKVEPDNAAAKASIHSAIVRRWLVGVETDQTKIDKAVDELAALMAKNPGNPDLPVFVARAKLNKAEKARQRNPITGDAEAAKMIDEANAVIATAVKNQPKNAAMLFGASQVMEQERMTAAVQAAQVAPRVKPKDPNSRERKLLDQYNATADKYLKLKKQYLDQAAAVASEDDSLFVYIHINAASAAAQVNDRASAEKILRELLKKKPDDQQVRLALAEHIAMDKREEAIEILDQPLAARGLSGPKSLVTRALEIRSLASVTSMRLDAYTAPGMTAEQKTKLGVKIEEGINRIILKEGADNVRTLLLRGKYYRAQGKSIDAIQTLERALAVADQDQQGQERQLDRWEATDLLARSYIETKQSGRAKDLLDKLVRKFESYAPARILLAQLLIREQQMDVARQHVEILRQQRPSDPDVIKLEIQLLDPVAQKDQVHKLLIMLPEKTKKEAMDKVNTAMAVKDNQEAGRVMTLLDQQYPKDDEVLRLGFRVFRTLGMYDQAGQVVRRAKEVHPEALDLDAVESVATTAPSQETKKKLQDGLLAKEKDPFRRELLLAEFARDAGKSDDQLAHLKAAAAIKPDDLDLKLQLFNAFLVRKQFEVAANYIEPLARANKDQVNGLLLKYRLAMAKGDINGGIDMGRKLVQTMPEFGQSWLALAEALQAAQQYDEALQRYLAALNKQSDNPVAYRGAIECYYALGKKEDAKRMIAQARSVMPSNGQFLDMELNHELSFGDPESVIPGREEALKKNPEDPSTLLMAGRTYMSSARSRLRKNPDDKANATAYLTKAKQLFGQGVEKFPDEPSFYAYAAEVTAQLKDLPGAENVLRQLAARPAWKERAEPLMLLGEFFARTNRQDEAVRILQQAMTKAPTNVDVEMRLATVLADQKKYEDAIKVLGANAEDPRIIRRRIEIMISAGKFEEADSQLAAAQAKMPSLVDLRALGGSISLSRNRFEEAQTRLQEALRIDPKHAQSHYYLGLVLMNQPRADVDGAIAQFNACKDAAGVGVDARRALADCLRRKNDFEGAVRELETAQKANPSNRDIVLALLDSYAKMSPPRWLDVKRVIAELKTAPDYRPDVEILKREADMYLAQTNYVDAADALGNAIKAAPGNIELVRQYLALLIKTQNYPIVVQNTSKLVEQDPNRWWAFMARAQAKRYLTDRVGALADYQLALDAASKVKDDDAVSEVVRSMAREIGVGEAQMRIKDRADKEPRWALMSAFLYQQDNPPKIDEAVKQLEKVLVMPNLSQADREQALRYGGALYLQTRPKPETQKAYDCYLKLLDSAPNDLTALNNMACLLAEVMSPPRPDEALKYSKHAFEVMQKTNTREPMIMDTHGWMLTLAGQVDDGIALLQNVVDTSPIVDARYHLAEAYLKKAFPDEARKQLDLARAMIQRMKSENRPYDPTLDGKIEQALGRAEEMRRSKSQANSQ
ncbi:MAG TPA: tetratricopeptide repeat protein [Tepidisphaeraceae bacterium]